MANMKMFMSTSDDSYFGVGFKLPYNELLIWAVLSNLHKMALFVWERGDENLAKALVAGKLFKALAEEMAKDELKTDVSEELQAHSWYVEMLLEQRQICRQIIYCLCCVRYFYIHFSNSVY